MKLATLRTRTIDGELVVVSRDLRRMVSATDIAPTLQAALDMWDSVRPLLEQRYHALLAEDLSNTQAFSQSEASSPLPRAFQWCDGSTYAAHEQRMARWRNIEPAKLFAIEPFMYQGASDGFLAPHEDIPAVTEDWGVDY
jgi:fumarylacetoacetate (FAA) hydrolase